MKTRFLMANNFKYHVIAVHFRDEWKDTHSDLYCMCNPWDTMHEIKQTILGLRKTLNIHVDFDVGVWEIGPNVAEPQCVESYTSEHIDEINGVG